MDAGVGTGSGGVAEASCSIASTSPSPRLLADLNALGKPLWAIVEHDMYPAPPGAPLPIATRTCRYYASHGLA